VATAEDPFERLKSDALALTAVFEEVAAEEHLASAGGFPWVREYISRDRHHELTLAYGMGPRGTVVTLFSLTPSSSQALSEKVTRLLYTKVAARWAVHRCADVGMPSPVQYD
jgi:hypothetical protein